jgi:hypothetical protein
MSEQNFDYFHQLCASHANLGHKLATYIDLANEGGKDFGQILEKFYFQGDKGKENFRKFNLLIKWHRMLSGKPDTTVKQLEELETDLEHLFDGLHTIQDDEAPTIENKPATMPAATLATLNKATEQVVDHPFDPITPTTPVTVTPAVSPSIAAASLANKTMSSQVMEPSAEVPPTARHLEPLDSLVNPVVNPPSPATDHLAAPVAPVTTPPAIPVPEVSSPEVGQGIKEEVSVSSVNPSPGAPEVTIEELLEMFNDVIVSAHRYLGKSIALGHIESSRPDHVWLEHFELKTPKQLVFHGGEEPVTPEQLEIFQTWVKHFVKDCSVIISDFPNMINYQEIAQIFKR